MPVFGILLYKKIGGGRFSPPCPLKGPWIIPVLLVQVEVFFVGVQAKTCPPFKEVHMLSIHSRCHHSILHTLIIAPLS